MRRNLRIRTVWLAAAGAVAALAGGRPARAADPVPSPAGYRSALLATEAPPEARDEAARRLAAGGTPADVAALSDAIRAGPPAAQERSARAIAGLANPDPAWVDPLAALLNRNRAVADAVTGLTAYAQTPSADRALAALQQFATGSAPPLSRAFAVRALGSFPARQAVLDLLAALAGGNPSLQRAAGEGLAAMTGEPDRGSSPAAWNAWWAGHAGDPPAVLQAYLRGVQARDDGVLNARLRQLADDTDRLLPTAYFRVPDAEKMPLLLQYLQASSAAIRATGAKIVTRETNIRSLSDDVSRRVRHLIDDDDADVRREAIAAVQKSVDPLAGPFLVARLDRERSPDLRVRLMQTLVKLNDLDAAQAMLNLLADRRPGVAVAAARALADLGALMRQRRPGTADAAAAVLRRIIDAQPPPPDDLRAACVVALARLGDPQAFATFKGLLFAQPPESRDVRVAALNGFGILADPNAHAIVADFLKDEDRRIRYSAAQALRDCGTPNELELLANLLNPHNESDPDIREAAWQAMARQFRDGDVGLLEAWAGRFPGPENAAHRLEVRNDYGRALRAAQQPDAVAANEQDVAEALMELNRPDEAVTHLQQAVDYYRRKGEPLSEGLIGQVLDAQLAARQYPAAAAFAADQIKVDNGLQRLIAPKFLDQVDQLKKDGRTADGNALVEAAVSMQPPLVPRYVEELKRDHTPPLP